jgi:FkbM family methyltransferase
VSRLMAIYRGIKCGCSRSEVLYPVKPARCAQRITQGGSRRGDITTYREDTTRESRYTPAEVEAALSVARAYIRFCPIDFGKAYLWKRYFEPYLGWRTELKPRVVKTRFGFSLQVKLPDTIQKVVLLTGRWEPFLTRFVLDTLGSGDTFVDLGANIGYYSLLASRLISESGRVYSIEASPSIFGCLRENVARNHVTNITAIHAIVSDKECRKPFWLAPEPHGGRSTTLEAVASHLDMHLEAYVWSSPLIDLIPTESLFNARLIKVDVEGAEGEVLRPLVPLLSRFCARTRWMVELSPELSPGGQADIDWIYQSFCSAGYRAFAVPNTYSPAGYLARVSSAGLQQLSRPPTTQSDVVFVRH